jgi:hypothetical protein
MSLTVATAEEDGAAAVSSPVEHPVGHFLHVEKCPPTSLRHGIWWWCPSNASE